MTDAKATTTSELLPEAVLPEVYRQTVRVPTKRYRLGIRDQGLKGPVTLAGITIPVFTEEFDAEGNPFRKLGTVLELTAEQCSSIKENVRNRIVRWFHYPEGHKKSGQKMRAEIHDVRVKTFTPAAHDEPFVKHLYVEEVPAEAAHEPAPAAAFEALDKAVADAAASSRAAEAVKADDPVDNATKFRHGVAKAAGKKVSDLDLGQL